MAKRGKVHGGGRNGGGRPFVAKADRTAQVRQDARALHTGSPQWRWLRGEVLREALYVCAACGGPGDQVDHIDGDSHNNARTNLQCMCRSCHARKTLREMGQRAALLPHLDHRPRMPVTVLCGPSGSGKSTYAQAHASNGDLIIDVDVIRSRMSKRALYDDSARDVTLDAVLTERNRLIQTLCTDTGIPRAWLIASAPRYSDRLHWQQELNADVLTFLTPADVCIARLLSDPARAVQAPSHWEGLVRKWWDAFVADPPGGHPRLFTVEQSGLITVPASGGPGPE